MSEAATQPNAASAVDILQILEMLPHRYPFLLVDRVLEYERGARLRALKNVTMNEPFFQGHFPGTPVMPGVLILESMAQAGGILVSVSTDKPDDSLFIFTSIERVRFRRPVYPGDQLILNCWDIRTKRNFYKMHCDARVEGDLAAEASLTAALLSRDQL